MNEIAEVIPTWKIKRVLRQMRGGSQAYLVEAENDRCYVCKFQGNPQGARSLINECIAHRLLRCLLVSTPNICALELSEELGQSGEIFFSVASRRILPQGILHFGSECPVHPKKKTIFDFLPARLLPSVVNLSDFVAAFTLDQWLH
ncbi:MAG: hypothetical protein ACRD19_04410, partial [Terriglobia bacterium]